MSAKRNWSTVETGPVRKPNVAHMAKGQGKRRLASDVVLRIDYAFVAASFAAKRDADRDQPYQPPIVGRTVCR